MNPFNKEFQSETLQWQKVCQRQIVSGCHIDNIAVHHDVITDNFVLDMNAFVLGKKLPSFTETRSQPVNIPKNPWQHFKMIYAKKWFMRKLVKKWPVKYERKMIVLSVTWDQWASYPWQNSVPLRKDLTPVRIIGEPRSTINFKE